MSTIAKALVGGLVAAYALYQVATGASSAGGETVVLNEWVGIGITGAIAGLGVWAVPNAPQPPPTSKAPDVDKG